MKISKRTKGKISFGVSIGLLLVAIFIIGALIFSSLGNAVIDSIAAIYGNVLVMLTNESRAQINISKLEINPLLEEAAQLKANDMAEKGYFSHYTPDGKSPWYWFELVGYKYRYAGENLAVNFTNSEDVQTAWMNSPGHRWNILNPRFTEIGIATATGYYKGRQAVFVVQLFGRPKSK